MSDGVFAAGSLEIFIVFSLKIFISVQKVKATLLRI